jgi:NAD(P)-dependent dehydrogenase (short-subunit alcohol dehydrogenase family)
LELSGKGKRVTSRPGRVALVTGAGLGIGQGIAIELARQGMRVAVHYAHSDKGARETVAEIEKLGGEAVAFGADLRKVAECRQLVDDVAAKFGGLDVLVNNAGVTVSKHFLEVDEQTFDDLFALNIRAYYFLAQQATPHLERSGHGSIINLSSIHGAGGFPLHVAYASTKGAVVAFTRTLSIELAEKQIRVNAIAPGVIEVPRYFDMPGYTREYGNTLIPWGRVGLPADIGTVAAFLASDGAGFVTGQTIYVDGGTSARMGLFWGTPEE